MIPKKRDKKLYIKGTQTQMGKYMGAKTFLTLKTDNNDDDDDDN